MPHRPAVAFSRHLGFAGAVALGGGVALAVVAVVGPLLVETAGARGSGAHLLAALLFLPLVLSRLDVPGSDGDAYLSTRGITTGPGLSFAVGWTLLGGYLALSALLTEALVGRLAEIGGALFGLEPRGWVLTLTVLGLVAINELLGTRGQERPLLGLVAVAALLLAGDFAWALWRWSDDASVGSVTAFAGSGAAHRLLPLALLAATLWGPELVLERRRVLQRVARNAPRAVVAAWIAAHAVGALGLLVALERPRLLRLTDDGSWIDHRPELVLAVAVVLLCLLGLSQSLAGAVRLAQELAGDGLLPSFLVRHRSERGVPYVPLVAAVALVAPWVSHASTVDLVAASALAILLASALALWPHARRRRRDLPERSLGLPLHPVLPMVAIGSALFLALLLRPAFTPFALWSAVGIVLFLLVGRRGAAEVAKRERFVAESDDVDPEVGKVLVAVGGGPSTESLVRVAAALARAREHELVVLRVAVLVEQTPLEDQRREAENLRRALAEQVRAKIDDARASELVVHVAVRIAPTIAAGILETITEMGADFLVVGWSGGEEGEPSASLEPVVETVFPATSKAMAVVHGPLPKKIRRVLVGSAGGPHAAVAVELAGALGREAEETSILNVVTPGRRGEEKPIAAGEEALRQTREKAGAEEDAFAEIGERVVHAGTIEEGFAREAGEQDALLLGASIDRLLDQTVLGGFPQRIALSRRGTTLIVKRAEGRTRFWRRRIFEGISGLLPSLDDTERVQLMAHMRRSSRADVDFYLLISLSASIAALGLMQSSPAVVIGAMLVAPLMSPILAMGHAVVLGYPRLLRRAASSTLKGMGLAVAVGALFALIFPSIRPTSEILARGAPSLLDLLVALASGAAAAYAVSRRSVAAALPGVAIAAALVPPLCVVGYGLGASELALSGGALLLFTTNLAGIVLSGATVFVLLGVRPARPGTGRHVWRGLLTTGLLLGVVAIPLVSETLDVLERSRLETRIVERLGDDRLAEAFTVRDLEIERAPGGGVVVHATILEHGRAGESDLDLGPLEDARRRLEAELGVPIRLRATVFRGTFVEMGE